MGLVQPPKQERTARVFLRILVLAVLVLGAGVLIWSASVNQRIALTEDTDLSDLELADTMVIDGLTIHLVDYRGGPTPVVFLHDFDIAGGVVWDDAIAGLSEDFNPVRVDLPGFGLSSRLPQEGNAHTVASMAGVMARVLEQRFGPAILVGVGLGGKVAAEVAVTEPGLVRGLVLVDSDFWPEPGWVEFLEGLPFVGPAVTFTFESAGNFGLDRWAPQCGEGGWCPTSEQIGSRNLATVISGSTDSLRAFRRTRPSSLVPDALSDIAVPTVVVWSSKGVVPQESFDRQLSEIPGAIGVESDSSMSHVEDVQAIIDAIERVNE